MPCWGSHFQGWRTRLRTRDTPIGNDKDFGEEILTTLAAEASSVLAVKLRHFLNTKFVAAMTAVFCATGLLLAQAGSKSLVFEVASIRRAAQRDESATGRRSTGMGTTIEDPGQVSYLNMSLKSLLTKAYSVKPFQIRGPSWIDSERYDVIAKIPEGASKEDVPVMLQNLIIERFQMSLQTEMKEQPGYALLVGRSGSKLKSSDGDHYSTGSSTNGGEPVRPPSIRLSTDGVTIPAATMQQFAELLSRFFERPVIDSTGLQGTFYIALRDVTIGGSPGGQEM
jgi:uncharacterized protein (TIGR03435 family)